ncbi:MAG: acetoacetate--CoA ligase [Acidiferrobacterales bacterium]
MTTPLWTPSEERIRRANLTRFIDSVRGQWGTAITDYDVLYSWSVDEPEEFWRALWSFTGVIAERRGEVVLRDGHKMPGAQWFPDARLNFAENLLRRSDDSLAIVFWSEDKVQRSITYRALYDQVSQLAQALRHIGVRQGDRIAGYLPNMPETIVAMLAAASIGAVWSSCSPDFGVQGVLDRLGQITPKVLFSADGYFYNGKAHDSLQKLREIIVALPSLERTVVVPYVTANPGLDGIDHAVSLTAFVRDFSPRAIEFERLPFNHPLYIMYSSGTTGVPKCIVHGAGGTLVQHLKEHVLHVDVRHGDRLFYFTTCGWMMWNWLVSGLAAGATLVLYDGSPFYPSGNVLFDYADEAGINIFGTSAKYIDAVIKAGLKPAKTHGLRSLRTMLSTGSPLAPESFDFVYQTIKPDVCLSSISGGTDIVSCFALGNPLLPVWRGELQCRGLGMRVEVFDDSGRSVKGQKGELVCTAPFPSMPVGFWNDPDGKKYRAAYFERFPGVWCHGDYVELTEHDGMIIYGRSDAILNPGGVRIGTAEIYRQAEQVEEVIESLVIGQQWRGDVRVVLFVRLRDGVALDDTLIDKIKDQIRRNATPRHVPAKVIQIQDIPRTKSGKIVELAVRNVVHGEPIKNKEALANPEALDLFRDLPELQMG